MARQELMVEAVIYIVFCVLTGLLGIDRRMGFFGTFLIAIVTTPFFVLPVLLLTAPSSGRVGWWWWRRRNS